MKNNTQWLYYVTDTTIVLKMCCNYDILLSYENFQGHILAVGLWHVSSVSHHASSTDVVRLFLFTSA